MDSSTLLDKSQQKWMERKQCFKEYREQFRKRKKKTLTSESESNLEQGKINGEKGNMESCDNVNHNAVVEVTTSTIVDHRQNDEKNSGPNEQYHSKPLMEVIRKLICNSRQNTLLTNSQVIDILHVDFGINVTDIHDLEKDIYMTVVKKFLKDWPRWDQFDQIIADSKNVSSSNELEEICVKEYLALKSYLQGMLDLSKPLAKDAMEKFRNRYQDEPNEALSLDSSDVVMEVVCTRNQLNQLILKHPENNPTQNIFRYETVPMKINCNSISLPLILNSPNVKIALNIGNISYERVVHENLEHILLNTKLQEGIDRKANKVNNSLQICTSKPSCSNEIDVDIQNVDNFVTKLIASGILNNEQTTLITIILRDIVMLDLMLLSKKVKVGSLYRRFLTDYPYVRSLFYEEQKQNTSNYSLHIEEQCTPQLQMCLKRLEPIPNEFSLDNEVLKIMCLTCKLDFVGLNITNELVLHFNQYHNNCSPNWKCMNCWEEFSDSNLIAQRWYHECDGNEITTVDDD